MIELPMAKLMAEHCQDLLVAQCQQGVIDHDALVLPEAEEVCVAVRRAFGAIYLVELGEREFFIRRKILDLSSEFCVLQSFELVEQGLDEVGVKPHESEDQTLRSSPQVKMKTLPAPVHKPDCGWNERSRECIGKNFGLHHIPEKEAVGHLVEAMPLLDDKILVQRLQDTQWLVHPRCYQHPKQRTLTFIAGATNSGGKLPSHRIDKREAEVVECKVDPRAHHAEASPVLLVNL
mmetsp:Transcript_9588/g.19756  ORF Transcript_9588/g.19756 Transcript_9588/m.19756 type:complete len:234 (-) Transcript_9588:84-785(-)